MAKVKKTGKRTYSKFSGFTIITKVFKGLLILGIIAVFAASIFAGSKILDIAKTAPEVDLEKFLAMTSQSILLDDKGQQIETVQTYNIRIPVTLDKVSDITKKAFIATEDERFYEHHGVDFKRTIGVTLLYVKDKILGGDYSQGGSTLTQQLVKNIFLTTDKEASRKIQEMFMSLQIEKKVPKDKILETYLNTIFLGGRAHGIEAAAIQYFGKSAKDLTLIEAAYLAGVPTTPTGLYAFSDENIKDPSYYQNRTVTVLGQMYKNNYITKEEYDATTAQVKSGQIPFKQTSLAGSNKYQYEFFTRPAIKQVITDLAAKLNLTEEEAQTKLETGGFKIYTTLNQEAQKNVQDILNDPNNLQFKEYVDANGIAQPQLGAVVLEPHTGQVKVVIGGRGEEVIDGPNRAASDYFLRAVGSTVKPLTVFSAGIDQKIFDPASVFEDSPLTKEQRQDYYGNDPNMNFDDPTNPGNVYGSWMGYVNVRDALKVSSNLVSIKAAMTIGIPVSEDYATRYGLVLPPDGYSGISTYSLGQFPALDGRDGGNPLRVASAYSTFANNGVRQRPIFYTKVVDGTGKVILENQPATNGQQIIHPGTAYMMWDILKDVARETPESQFSKTMPIAGKTGTTQDNKELWFAGTTPYYSAAVFIGSDDHQSIINKNSGELLTSTLGAVPLWSKIMDSMHKGLEPKEIPIPDDIVKVAVSHDSGTLPTDLTRMDPRGDRTIEEWFFLDRVPTTFDKVHVAVGRRVYITRFYKPEVTLDDQKFVLPESLWQQVKDLMDSDGSQNNTLYQAPPEPVIEEVVTTKPNNTNTQAKTTTARTTANDETANDGNEETTKAQENENEQNQPQGQEEPTTTQRQEPRGN